MLTQIVNCDSFRARTDLFLRCSSLIRNPDLAPYQPGHPRAARRRSLYAGDALTRRQSTLALERETDKRTPAEADAPAGVPAIRIRIVELHVADFGHLHHRLGG